MNEKEKIENLERRYSLFAGEILTLWQERELMYKDIINFIKMTGKEIKKLKSCEVVNKLFDRDSDKILHFNTILTHKD